MKHLDPAALEPCLVTRERPRLELQLGFRAPACGEPPFQSLPASLALWSWPWTDWPLFDPAIFAVDRERIIRWYKARGHYEARIKSVRIYRDGELVEPTECTADPSECALDVYVQIDEGEAVHVEQVTLQVADPLSDEVRTRLREQLSLRQGERFDEARYTADLSALENTLKEAAFARARVTGKVTIDRAKRSARIDYAIELSVSERLQLQLQRLRGRLAYAGRAVLTLGGGHAGATSVRATQPELAQMQVSGALSVGRGPVRAHARVRLDRVRAGTLEALRLPAAWLDAELAADLQFETEGGALNVHGQLAGPHSGLQLEAALDSERRLRARLVSEGMALAPLLGAAELEPSRSS